MLYFGYGFNMLKANLECRLGPYERLGVAYLTGYSLRFHKESRIDHSGKCDAYRTGNPSDRVYGALDRLTSKQFKTLDKKEGGYCRRPILVTFGERTIKADLYLAKPKTVNPELLPVDSYKETVLAGARELDLPSDYIRSIEDIPSVPDDG